MASRYSRHLGERLVVGLAAQALHRDRVAHAEAEQEPVRERLGEGAMPAVHRQRVA
jgi:hypothetical protein